MTNNNHRSRATPDDAASDSQGAILDRSGCLKVIDAFTAQPGGQIGVLWFNIDRFKQVNDSFGHPAGDRLLLEIVHRLERANTGLGLVARMGGDEFALILPACERAQAERIARDSLAAIRQPLDIGNFRLRPAASIGIALSDSGEPAHELLERADRAMIEAKRQGGGQIVFAGDALYPGRSGKHLAREELEVEESLHRALETGSLFLEYQPIVRLVDGALESVEALMRCGLDGKVMLPSRFIPVAEKTGLIIRLGEWCLLTAARFVQRQGSAGKPLRVSVNVSRAQLTAPKFTQTLHAALACADIPPGSIELEITESLFMDRSELVQNNLRGAIEAGFTLAIDDFGTGYSCLACLKDLPATKLKLDRAFVMDLPQDKRSLSVSKAIVQLALDLGMTVVAEGVETAEQYQALSALGISSIQGHYLARPMNEDTLLAWLDARGSGHGR